MAGLLPPRYSQTFSIRLSSGGVGRQAHEGDVVGDGERGSDVIAGDVEDKGGVATRSDLADRGKMQRHDRGVRRRHHQACGDATLRTGVPRLA